jgi:hypothetical protein
VLDSSLRNFDADQAQAKICNGLLKDTFLVVCWMQQFGCRRSATESGCVGMQLNKARDAGQKEEFFIGCISLACREIWYFIIKMLIYTHLEEFVQEC